MELKLILSRKGKSNSKGWKFFSLKISLPRNYPTSRGNSAIAGGKPPLALAGSSTNVAPFHSSSAGRIHCRR